MNVIRLFSLVICSFVVVACSTVPEIEIQTTTQSEQVSIPDKAPAVTKLSVIAVGDIMLGTDFPRNQLPPDDGKQLLQHVSSILASADITFGNFEGTLLDGGEPAKTCKDPKHCYLFRTPPYYAKNLVNAGFDVVSLANNHARDFGEMGRAASMTALDQHGIRHSGLEGDVASWQVKGLKVALIAFAPFRGAHDPLMLEQASATVSGLAQRHDVVLVSMHMGGEGEEATRIPFAEETYHGENRGDVAAFSRAVVEAGADLVLGHGPHVPRAIELYKGRLIAYSLGNFCTYYGINVRGLNGLAPMLKVQLAADGAFIHGEIISARQYRPNGPIPDPSHQAARLIAELTRLDFPATPLEISQNGQISIKSDH